MNLLPVYRAIRARLRPIAPVYKYNGQYLPGKANTSYRVPAVYIEMPKPGNINYYPGGIKALKGIVTIHVITNAPFKNGEGDNGDNDADGHEELINEVKTLLDGWHAEVSGGVRILSQQLIPVNSELYTPISLHLISQIGYQSEFYAYP